jgi:cytochrome b6-f complex iron-sulfur subunit
MVGWKTLLTFCGALSLYGLFRYLSFQPFTNPQTKFDLGLEKELPKDNIISIPEAHAVLLSNQQGIRAISLTCTHLSCLVEREGDMFICPCHGSVFSLTGEVLKGPANHPLVELGINTDNNGHLILDISK